jgi:hypothetical protein
MDIFENSQRTLSLGETLETVKSTVGANDLRQQYYLEKNKPILMHTTFQTPEPMKWPAVIRSAYAKIWNGKHPRIIIKAPRGGGKSKLLGTAGFDLWYLKKRKVVNMAGSAVQAKIVYDYFKDYCDIDASIMTSVKGKLKAIETEGVDENYFSSVNASTKQVRGKHPDVLISDETCETSDELIHAALPMVDSSQDPMVIMASTFHKIFGIFQETWDSAEQRGYLRIQWDIFDVCKPFASDYFENGELKDGTKVATIGGVEKLKSYAKKRTGDKDGWVPIENVVQAWREKPTEDWFEVEYMGSRPSAAGLVLKPEDVDRAMFDSQKEKRYNYIRGATDVLGIDWGFSSMTSVVELMAHQNQTVVMLDNKNFHQTSSEEIIKFIVEKVKARGIRFIYADSAGKFENNALQTALNKEGLGCSVIEVVFSKEKEGMLGNFRAHFEQGKIKIPKKVWRVDDDGAGAWMSNLEAYWQCKRYRYQEGTNKPVKKDDHIPDAIMCALQHFILGQFARAIPTKEKEAEKKPVKNTEEVQRKKPITAGLLKKQF